MAARDSYTSNVPAQNIETANLVPPSITISQIFKEIAENKMSEKDSEKSYEDQRMSLLHNFILNFITFSANGAARFIIKFASLCSIPLIIGNYMPVGIASMLWLALLLVHRSEYNEHRLASHIAWINGSSYNLARDEVFDSRKIVWTLLLSIAYFASFFWNFTFKEAVYYLVLLPLLLHFGLKITFGMLGSYHIDFSSEFKINNSFPVRENDIYLKNIYKQVAFKLLSHPNNREGLLIKKYIEERFNIHNSDG